MISRDVFICHASEDKAGVCRPIVIACEKAGIRCWFDEAEIHWGDSITQKVNEGLAKARFVVVVLSTSFLEKHWPQRELHAILNIEASSGEIKVLPLLVGSPAERKAILEKLPLLNDKLHLTWNKNASEIVKALSKRLAREKQQSELAPAEPGTDDVYRPRIKKKFTDRDRSRFLQDAFIKVRKYFARATKALSKQHEEIDAEITDSSPQKFVCRIYQDGNERCVCKVWIGGMMRDDGICYSEGQWNFSNDNSYNEILSVADNGDHLYLKDLLGTSKHGQKVELTAEDAAESLWKRFCAPLEY